MVTLVSQLILVGHSFPCFMFLLVIITFTFYSNVLHLHIFLQTNLKSIESRKANTFILAIKKQKKSSKDELENLFVVPLILQTCQVIPVS